MFGWILFGALAVTAILILAFVRWADRRSAPDAQKFLCSRCPQCRQKTRFLASRLGQQGKCPRCKHTWELTVTPVTTDESDEMPAFPGRRLSIRGRVLASRNG
jgi:uncharacterized paraquat-inducible protein A